MSEAKILLLTLEFPPQVGGVASYLAGFVEALKSSGCAAAVLNVSLGRSFLSWKRLFVPAWRAVRKEHPSVLLISHVLPAGFVALVFKVFARLPYVVIVHGMDVLLPQQFPWKRFWLTLILKNARAIVANSGFTKQEVVRLGLSPAEITVVYPCASEQLLKFSVAIPVSSAAKRILLTVGRLVPRKGHDTVIRSLHQIAEQIPEVVYFIAGDGPERERLTQLAEESGVAERVVFLGTVPELNMPALYASADIFVMPARQMGADVEGFGLVFLEANAFGKPVIGGRSGGVPEAVADGETGLIVPPDEPAALADAAIRLFKDQDLAARLGERGRERVREEFRWETQIKKAAHLWL